jgi:hypothetical protein
MADCRLATGSWQPLSHSHLPLSTSNARCQNLADMMPPTWHICHTRMHSAQPAQTYLLRVFHSDGILWPSPTCVTHFFYLLLRAAVNVMRFGRVGVADRA